MHQYVRHVPSVVSFLQSALLERDQLHACHLAKHIVVDVQGKASVPCQVLRNHVQQVVGGLSPLVEDKGTECLVGKALALNEFLIAAKQKLSRSARSCYGSKRLRI